MASIRPLASHVAGLFACVCVVALVVGCGRRGAEVTQQPGVRGPRSPTSGLVMPRLDVEWTPPMLAAGDLEGLAAAVAGHSQLHVVLGDRLAGEAWTRRAGALVATLGPATTVTGGHAALVEVVGPAEELRTPRRTTAAADGRPRYAATLTVQARAATLAIDDAAVDLPRWQALASSTVGTCEPAMRALAEGQEVGLIQLAPFLDHVDARLDAVYRAGLQRVVPGLKGEACVQAIVKPYAACLADERLACPGTPRIVLTGGASVVAAAPVVAEDGCVAATVLRGVADAAAASVVHELDRGWTVLADRLGTLTDVHAVLEDLCVPRRRRMAAEHVDEARTRLGRIGAGLASDDLDVDRGGWSLGGESLVVPGLGPTRVLARFVAGPGSVSAGIVADARALREFVLMHSLCKAGHAATPMAAVVVDPERGIEFFGYFYEEELFCGSLPPLGR